MKKYLIVTISVLFSVVTISFGQALDKDLNDASGETKVKYNGVSYVYASPAKDMNSDFTITGINLASFSVSNKADGTENSFKHKQRIVFKLMTNIKTENVELVFYSEELPYTVNQAKEGISVYFPLSMYESLKQKLDESLIAKKKVVLKIALKTDGFREAQFIF